MCAMSAGSAHRIRCASGCDWDACQICVDSFEKGILEKEAGKGTKNIMRKWRERPDRAQFVWKDAFMQSSNSDGNSCNSNKVTGQVRQSGDAHSTNTHMPTPERVIDVDPSTEHCYYHDPQSITQWEHPCPDLVAPTFSASDLLSEPGTNGFKYELFGIRDTNTSATTTNSLMRRSANVSV